MGGEVGSDGYPVEEMLKVLYGCGGQPWSVSMGEGGQ